MRPFALVGRDEEQGHWDASMRRLELGRPGRSTVLYGLRGVGKTVLLGDLATRARRREWIVGSLEAGNGASLRELIAGAFITPLAELAKPSATERIKRALHAFTSFRTTVDAQGSWSFGLDLSQIDAAPANTGLLDTDLAVMFKALCVAAEERGKGVALTVDEAQDLTLDELSALCALLHDATQQELPLLIALAGLPSLPRILGEARSYAERQFEFRNIASLTPAAASQAVTDPAEDAGVSWTPDALAEVLRSTDGYPYFIQEFGQQIWLAADESPITLEAALRGGANAREALDRGFFRARWDRATISEQRYLRAMAIDGSGPSQSGTVAQRLDKQLASLGPARANLIRKGVIYAPDHGQVAFTVPHMADYINRQPTE